MMWDDGEDEDGGMEGQRWSGRTFANSNRRWPSAESAARFMQERGKIDECTFRGGGGGGCGGGGGVVTAVVKVEGGEFTLGAFWLY